MIPLPSLDQEAQRALRESIESFGVVVPVVYNHGELIDGHNRTKIASELDLDVPRIDLELDSDQAEQLAVELNTARREMSLDIRRSITKSLKQSGYGNRAIAKVVGVNEITVRRDLKTTATPVAVPEQTLGLDGKYRSTKPKTELSARGKPQKLHRENGVLSERQQQLSGGVKKRLDKLAGTCDALGEAPQHLNLHYALETASAQEIAGWTASVKAGITGLKTILKTLEAAK